MHVPPIKIRHWAAPLGYGSSVVNHGFPVPVCLELCVNGLIAENQENYVYEGMWDLAEW